MKTLACFSIILFLSFTAQAKIWRINPDLSKDADFISPGAAITDVNVVNGDTLHIEPSAGTYPNFILNNKRLVFLGNGYFLTNNPNLQANTLSSTIPQIIINNALANGSVFSGLVISVLQMTNVENITITHCNISQFTASGYTIAATGITFRKCFLGNMTINSFPPPVDLTLTIENCIISNTPGIGGTIVFQSAGGLFRNNVFNNTLSSSNFSMSNFYIANNIFTQLGAGPLSGSNNVIRNNLHAGTAFPSSPDANGNIGSVNMANVFIGPLTTAGDARFVLKPGPPTNPAIGAGETIGGITPDCGAYGATDPYRLSGIPGIPSIYLLIVPPSIAPTQTQMNVTVSTRSNN
jgi:hypothetical protein